MNIFSEKLIAWYAENKLYKVMDNLEHILAMEGYVVRSSTALAVYHRPLYYMDFRDYTATDPGSAGL